MKECWWWWWWWFYSLWCLVVIEATGDLSRRNHHIVHRQGVGVEE